MLEQRDFFKYICCSLYYIPTFTLHPFYVAMGLQEAITKSSCQPIAQHVNVAAEFPDGVEYIYTPSCVLLFRCSGGCMDEALECYPTSKRNITVEVRKDQGCSLIPFLTTKNIQPHLCPPYAGRCISPIRS